jgi:ParB-like nuclease family protein
MIIYLRDPLSPPGWRQAANIGGNIWMHANTRRKPARQLAKSSDLEIIYRPLSGLKPDPTNPRRHSKKQIRQIAASIRVFGFSVPVLVDSDLNVIAGHGRLLACHELGITEVPTLCLGHLTPAQTRAFMIVDNRLTEIATWDDRLLAEQLRDLSLSGLDFDIEVTGFEMGEIDLRIASYSPSHRMPKSCSPCTWVGAGESDPSSRISQASASGRPAE